MKKGKTIRTVLIVMFAALFLFSGYKLLSIYLGYKEASDFYTDVREDFLIMEDVPQTEDAPDSEAGSGESESSPSADTTAKTPARAPFSVNFDKLLAFNPDVVGWLYCADTPLNYPVAQSDDNDYYLRRALDGSDLVTGTIFADCTCTAPMQDRNYILYGHYMRDGSIFGCFEKYYDQSYYEQHPVMYYYTPQGKYKIEIFAGLLTNTSEFPYRANFSDEDFEGFLGWARENSFIASDVAVGLEDKIISLSTCSYAYEEARTVILGRLTPAD